jgi:hypothetical protein
MIRAWCNTPDGCEDPPAYAYPATREAWERVAAVVIDYHNNQLVPAPPFDPTHDPFHNRRDLGPGATRAEQKEQSK